LFVVLTAICLQAQEPVPTARLPEESSGIPFGVGVKISTLGPGAEVAVGMTPHFSLRAGANYFQYSVDSSRDGVSYKGVARLQTLEGHLDWFPWGGKFHVSPGIVYFLKEPLTANIAIPGGTDFTLGDTNFVSSTTDPTTGSASLRLHKAAPAITAGWGNLATRAEGKHWSFPVEFGVAFHGTPQIRMALQGQACEGAICYNAATDPNVQGPLAQEIQKREKDVSWFKVYPILSVGIGYRF
jgi:hypothetical protein